jgi:hypothetical protein
VPWASCSETRVTGRIGWRYHPRKAVGSRRRQMRRHSVAISMEPGIPMAKRGTSLTGALREARKPYRLFLLRVLSSLQEQSSAEFFPLSLIMAGEVHGSDIRNALRGLYSAGMVRTGPGGYALTELGRSALVNVWASSKRHPRAQGL